MDAMQLLLPVAILLISCASMGVKAGKKPVIYKKWPACKRGSDFVYIVKSDRVPGEVHERTNRNGKTIWYICLPCTQCASGVRQLHPCSTYNDTKCSATECAVPGCVLDEMFHACRLPGDPNDFASTAAMMDPCDPTKAPVNPTPIPSEGDLSNGDLSNGPPHHIQLKNSSSSLSKKDKNEAGDAQNGPNKPNSAYSSGRRDGYGWGTLEVVLIVVLLSVVLIMSSVIGVMVFIFCRRSEGKAQSGRGTSSSNEGRTTGETAI
ncbi:uncharacterized protein LOC119724479 [Patiria miniata]|uniref:TNFR-Cys domain-containing protein n=1 Tax=Patiria miniata TaxID=46514 RepID=A0A913ZK65_PATMI|nr:uncharacterized protein LOC119724479 [Patiria miniata]